MVDDATSHLVVLERGEVKIGAELTKVPTY